MQACMVPMHDERINLRFGEGERKGGIANIPLGLIEKSGPFSCHKTDKEEKRMAKNEPNKPDEVKSAPSQEAPVRDTHRHRVSYHEQPPRQFCQRQYKQKTIILAYSIF